MNSQSYFPAIRTLVRAGCFLSVGLLGSLVWADNAVLHPAYINGEVRFGNTKPDILALLNAGPGSLIKVEGNSISPAPPLHFSAQKNLDAGPPPFAFDLTVEGASAGSPGYAYQVSPDLVLSQQYAPRMLPSPALNEGDSQPLIFDDCPALLDVRFVDSPGGTPVSVTSGQIIATDAGAGGPHVIVYGVTGTSKKVLVHSGSPLYVAVDYSRGSDPLLDLVNYHTNISISTPLNCDDVKTVEVVVPGVGSPGGITGTVDMVGETVLLHDSGAAYNLNTVMVADNSYSEAFYQFGRYTFLNTTPSSGPFTLPGLLPSADMDAMFGTHGYRVWGRLQFRSGHAANFFRTPSLVNPGVTVPAGATVDLGNTFNLQPGYVAGDIILSGLADEPGDPSPFRHLLTASDGSGSVAPYLTSLFSSVEARGVDAPAQQGVGVAEFGGAFDGDKTYFGNYELVLAGLNSQPSVWDLSRFNLYFNSTGTGDPYIVGKLLITDRLPSQKLISPMVHTNRNLNYCFGRFTLQFEAPPGTKFFRPEVAVHGHFSGLDELNQPADYDVDTGPGYDLGTAVPVPFLGEPVTQGAATNTGVVRLALPQGTYTFTPIINVVSADGTVSTVNLPTLTNIVVDCGSGEEGNPCLIPNVSEPPECATPPSVRITGSVSSCTNVSKIAWEQGDNVEHVICEGCGKNPSFAFDLPVINSCADQTFTVTVYDVEGRVASATRVIRGDHLPPTLNLPTNLVVECASPNGVVVNYSVWASDNCDPDPTVSCAPASGSLFPLGNTTVQCLAIDRCGNTNSGSFTVTVTTNCPQSCLDLHCPTNLIAYTCGSNCVPVYYSPWAQNLCNPTNVWVATYPPSGTCFTLGSHTVDVWAGAGSESNHCSFTVTVLPDPYCPTNPPCLGFYVQSNITAYACGSNCVPVNFIMWATNFCDPTNLVVVTDHPSGSCFYPGTTWVNATAYGSGQSVQINFPVTVLPDPNCTGGCTNANLRITPTITVEWDCGILQSASAITGPYADVPGATSPSTVPATGPEKYFRTR